MASAQPIESLTYESAFAELESVVAALESEQHPLDESIALYERGQALLRHCAALLEKAELRVQQVAGDSLTAFDEGDA